MKRLFCSLLSAVTLLGSAPAFADPCGMVPPVWTRGMNNPIRRTGIQRTYVFYEDGVETFVIRPEFSGQVDQFGMLIPFPSPPAMRKVPDQIFDHIAKAIDPPEINLWVGPPPLASYGDMRPRAPSMAPQAEKRQAAGLAFNEVRVIKQEAIGMYEVAVLEAGSATALERWMKDHDYRFPDGMQDTTNEYVEAGWCFVAVKARVGQMAGVKPRPGQRKVRSQLPKGATFDGAVQGMGFRFRVDELVVPMRLSAFNPGSLRNVVYLLSDRPLKIDQLPKNMVKRQLQGRHLVRNIDGQLPVRVSGGTVDMVTEQQLKNIEGQRNPSMHNGLARELFLSDAHAAKTQVLANSHEETEKSLLAIGEELNLRGKEIDALVDRALQKEKDALYEGSVDRLSSMTLTVIDGDFPRELIAKENLRFAAYRMPSAQNKAHVYDARFMSPGPRRDQPSNFFWGRPAHLTQRKVKKAKKSFWGDW